MKSCKWRIAFIALSILCIVSIIINVIYMYNFETTRIRYVDSVKNYLIRLYNEVSRAADDDFNEMETLRDVRLLQSRIAMECLSVSLTNLSGHYNWQSGGTGFPIFDLSVILELLLRYEENPYADLRLIAEKLLRLYENIEPNMKTQEIFDFINEINSEIRNDFKVLLGYI